MSQVKILKISTGEEVIAGQLGINQFSRPRTLRMTQEGVGLVPWILLDPDAETHINPNHIITMIDAPPDVEKSYLQNVSSIQLLG